MNKNEKYSFSTSKNFDEPPPSYEESLTHQKVQEYAPAMPTVKYSQSPNPNYQYGQTQQQVPNFQQKPAYNQQSQAPVQSSYLYQQQQQVFIPEAFDCGAHFSSTSPPSIPPPPPGVAPNAAQIAAQHGLHIVTSKKNRSFF